MSKNLDEILSRIKINDDPKLVVVEPKSKGLISALRRPRVYIHLFQIMRTSQTAQNRQLAALLLSEKLCKEYIWKGLKPDTKDEVTIEGCLGALVAETENHVAHAIARLVATLAKYQDRLCPELLQFLRALSPIAVFTLVMIAEHSVQILIPEISPFLPYFREALQNGYDGETVRILTHVFPHIGTEHGNWLKEIVPLVLAVTGDLANLDEDQVELAVDLLPVLIEINDPMVTETIFNRSLIISGQTTFSDQLRAKAISGLNRVIEKKPEFFTNDCLVSLLERLFQIVCDKANSGEEIPEPLLCCALQKSKNLTLLGNTIKTLAFLPHIFYKDYLMSEFVPFLQSGLTSGDPAKKRGAFYSITAIATGFKECHTNIHQEYLENFLRSIVASTKEPAVRNPAFLALEKLLRTMEQAAITNYQNLILEALFNFFDSFMFKVQYLTQLSKIQFSLNGTLSAALGYICQNLAEKVPAELLDRLTRVLTGNYPDIVQTMCVYVIGLATNAVKEAIIPYFETIIPYFETIMNESLFLIPISSAPVFRFKLETLSSLAKAVGVNHFTPQFAEASCNWAIRIDNYFDDCELRCLAFDLFSTFSLMLKEDMSPVLANILPILHKSLSKCREEDEKEKAIVTFKDICKNTGQVFVPYLQKASEEILKLIDVSKPHFKCSVIEALSQFSISYYKFDHQDRFEELVKVVAAVINESVKKDKEATVVSKCLGFFVELLKNCKNGFAQIDGIADLICDCIYNVLNCNCACMDNAGHSDKENQDKLIYECLGQLILEMGRAMDAECFSLRFSNFAPMLVTMTNNTTVEKLFSLRSIVNCLELLEGHLDPFVVCLNDMFLSLSSDRNEDVKSKAIFGLGVLVLHGGQAVARHYLQIFGVLSSVLNSDVKTPRVIDKVVGCLCRLILAASETIDIVLPIIFDNLPLREDVREYEVVFKALQILHTDGHPMVRTNMLKIVDSADRIRSSEEIDDTLRTLVMSTMETLRVDLAPEFKAAQDGEIPN